MKAPDERKVQYFRQIVESGSMRGAAEILGLDASVISRAVSSLEAEMGMRLLERRGRGVVPTEMGCLLATYARRQLGVLETFYAEVTALQDGRRGQVDITVGEGLLEMLFDPLVLDFMRRHPAVTVNLIGASTAQAVANVIDDIAHIGLIYHPPTDIRLRTHYTHSVSPIQAIVHKSHPLTRIGRPLKLSDLMLYPGATLHEGFGLRQYVQIAEALEEVSLPNILITTSFRVLCQFARSGIGYTLCGTAYFSWVDIPDLVALPMEGAILNRGSVQVVTRHGRHIPPAATSLLRHIIDHLSDTN